TTQKGKSCTYYRKLSEVLGDTMTSPIWYLGMFGHVRVHLVRQVQGPQRSVLQSLLKLVPTSTGGKLNTVQKLSLNFSITLKDVRREAPDWLVEEKKFHFDGNNQVIEDWAQSFLLVNLKDKDLTSRGFRKVYYKLLMNLTHL
ncbi:unnamed protein product, partial [Lymnaea stagnalis]